MGAGRFINLYVYSDSLAFPRRGGQRDLALTYPFRLRDLIESTFGIRTNVLFRGFGAADIRKVSETLFRDLAYLGGDDETCEIAVFQLGIVDCAPRPITYLLVPTLRRIPIIGGRAVQQLVKYRRVIQATWSYKKTSRRRFQREYSRMVNACRGANVKPIGVGLPLPTATIERRSPGFRRSAGVYNAIIREAIPDSFCDIEEGMSESSRVSMLLPDGHHLTAEGHQYYAEKLLDNVRKLVQQ